MSGTSVKIFGNDMAMDVKEDFCRLYGVGKSTEEINAYILRHKPDDDDEEACAFWSALALIEWQYGVLTDDIKLQAKRIIECNDDVHLFIKEKDAQARRAELMQLLELLETENTKPKKRRKTYVYRTTWKQGDVIAFPVKERWVYFHVCSVHRPPEKIEELEEDVVHVKLYNIISDNVFDISRFDTKASPKIGYANIDKRVVCTVKWLYSLGIKEQIDFEKKSVYVGNIPCKRETDNGRVFADFQFKRIEHTLIELFGL